MYLEPQRSGEPDLAKYSALGLLKWGEMTPADVELLSLGRPAELAATYDTAWRGDNYPVMAAIGALASLSQILMVHQPERGDIEDFRTCGRLMGSSINDLRKD